jgi:phosphoglycerate dehydrogenase-like enzyme
MKALLHYRASPALQRRLTEAAPAGLEIVYADPGTPLPPEAIDAEVLLHVLEPATAAFQATLPRLRLIQKIGVGVNTIDLDEARRRGIHVANMPGTNSQAVAEATLALMLAVLRKLVVFDQATRRGAGWAMPLGATDDVGEIHGKTVGFIGFGAVPQRLAPILMAMGARVIFHARRAATSELGEQLPLAELLAQSDILTLHVPLTNDTRRLIDAKALAAMKPGAILVNTARGGLVDEAALADALRTGHLRGAGLDVLDQEPAAAGHPFFALPNTVITPHLAWLTAETFDRSIAVIIDNCARLRDGLPLCHQVV